MGEDRTAHAPDMIFALYTSLTATCCMSRFNNKHYPSSLVHLLKLPQSRLLCPLSTTDEVEAEEGEDVGEIPGNLLTAHLVQLSKVQQPGRQS